MHLETGNDEIDAYFVRQLQVKEHLNEVKIFTHGPVPLMLDTLVETAKKDLGKISKKEMKLNTRNQDQIDILKSRQ